MSASVAVMIAAAHHDCEFWLYLFHNPLHLIYAAVLCLAVVLIAVVVIVKFRPAEVRQLAWRVFLATAAFYALSFILWLLRTGIAPLNDWKSILIIPFLALITHLFVVTCERLVHRHFVGLAVQKSLPPLLARLGTLGVNFHLGLVVAIQWWALMAAVVTSHFLWITVLVAFVGIVVGELGFCLKTDRRPGRIALLGSTLFQCP